MNKLFVLSALAVLSYVSAAPSSAQEAEWLKTFQQYIQDCKAQENANDEDVKIFTNRQQLPANEAQSCLLKCVDTKLGLVIDGKLQHDGFINAAKHIYGENNKEKLDEAENIFKKCQPKVEEKAAEKCGSGTAMRSCVIELSNIK